MSLTPVNQMGSTKAEETLRLGKAERILRIFRPIIASRQAFGGANDGVRSGHPAPMRCALTSEQIGGLGGVDGMTFGRCSFSIGAKMNSRAGAGSLSGPLRYAALALELS